MKYNIPLSSPFSNYDKVLLPLTGLALLWVTYIRSQSFKNGRLYFIFYGITAIPYEIILATQPYEPPKYMLQILNPYIDESIQVIAQVRDNSSSDKLRLEAAIWILEQYMGKAKQKTDVTSKGEKISIPISSWV